MGTLISKVQALGTMGYKLSNVPGDTKNIKSEIMSMQAKLDLIEPTLEKGPHTWNPMIGTFSLALMTLWIR